MTFVIYGPNRYQLQQEVIALGKKFTNQGGSREIERIDGEALEPEALNQLLLGQSLFSTYRQLVIKSLSKNKLAAERLLQLLEQISPDIEVVLVEPEIDKRTVLFKTLQKKATMVACEQPSEAELIRWIITEAKQAGGQIEHKNSVKLLEFVGVDQLRLKNEIEKLVAYDPKITATTIEKLVEATPGETVFQLLDASLKGEQAAALTLLDNMEAAQNDPFQVANLLLWQVNVLAVVVTKGDQSEHELAKLHGINPYVIKKTGNLARRTDVKKLRSIVDCALTMEIGLKTTAGNTWQILHQAVAEISSR